MIFNLNKIDFKEPLLCYIKRSSILHILFLVLVIIIVYITNLSNKNLTKRNIKLLEQSIQVELVAMPTQTMQELKKLTSKISSESINKQDEKIVKKTVDIIKKDDVVFKKKVKKKNFMEMLKDINQKNSKRKAKKRKTKKSITNTKKQAEEYNRLVLMGNKLSQGSSSVGKNSGDSVSALNLYAEKLLIRLRPLWKLPGYLKDLNLQCRIQIYLSQSGKLLRAEIYESSGNSEYDDKALSIVKKAAPFPQIPNEIIRNAVNGDLILGFPL